MMNVGELIKQLQKCETTTSVKIQYLDDMVKWTKDDISEVIKRPNYIIIRGEDWSNVTPTNEEDN